MKKSVCLLVWFFAGSVQAIPFTYTDVGNASENPAGTFTMSTGTSSVGDFFVEGFLGLAAGSLDALSPSTFTVNNVTEGSALKASISVVAGDTVSFDWLFTTNESLSDPFPASNFRDFAFYSLKLRTSAGPVLLADALLDNAGATGTEAIVLTDSGTLEIGVGVVDVFDTLVESFITASNFTFIPADPDPPVGMPEPGLLALLGLGLAGIDWSRRRKTV